MTEKKKTTRQKGSKKALTDRQKEFVQLYLATNNLYQSAILAGYSEKTAENARKNIMENRGVKAYYDKLYKTVEKVNQKDEHKAVMKASEMVDTLTRIARGEVKETKLVRDMPVEVTPAIKDRIKAIEVLSNMMPDSNPLKEAQLRKLNAEADLAESQTSQVHDSTAKITKKLEKLSVEELEKLAYGLEADD